MNVSRGKLSIFVSNITRRSGNISETWMESQRKVTARRAAIAIDEETAPPSPPIRSVGVLDLFRTPNMRLKTILITFNWSVRANC